MAGEGAKVIVNDVGGAAGRADGGHPAEEVVALIKRNGGEAEANGDDISSWQGASTSSNRPSTRSAASTSW